MLRKRLGMVGLSLTLLLGACGDDSGNNLTPKPEDEGKVVDGKTDAWNPTNNPNRFRLDFEYKWEELKSYEQGEAAQTPWPSDYWATYEDSTNVRYHGTATLSPMEKYDQAFNNWTPNMDLLPLDLRADCSNTYDGTIMDRHDEYYDHLGPAASWQHRNKGIYRARNGVDDDGDGKVDECGGSDYDGVETWWGLCHAWTPAAIIEPEPMKDVTVNGVTFTVSDLKALLITMYDRNSAVMIGGRCNEKEIERDEETGEIKQSECKDTNAGTFYVVIVNMLGIMERAFAEDRTANYQVWNQPLYKYVINEQREVPEEEAMQKLGHEGEKYKEVFDSPNAERWVYVDMTTSYVREASSTTEGPLVPRIGDFTGRDHYEYILELDSEGNIVGGEWLPSYLEKHPDFLWLPIHQRGGNPRISFAKVKELLDLSTKSDDPEPTGDIHTYENSTAVAIPDKDASGVTSVISVPDDVGIGSLKVEVDIEHTYVGDLVLTLTRGDTTVELQKRSGGGADNLHETYTVKDFDGQSAQGDWVLKVADLASADTGQILGWKLHVAASDLPLSDVRTYSSSPALSIPDNDEDGVSDTMSLSDEGSVKGLKVTVDITHTYSGDLVVTLVNGSNRQVLASREGGSTDDLKKTFTLTSFNGAPVAGKWVLEVTDRARADTGTLNSWSLEIEL